MNQTEIDQLFNEAICNTKALYKKVNGYSEDIIYNWKTNRTTPSIGDKLNILYQLNLIQIGKKIK